MKRLRDLFGGGGSKGRTERAAGGTAAIDPEPAEDEAERELRLQREFYTSLSEVARHELQFEAYAPKSPSQFDRRGGWVTAERVAARDASDRPIEIEAGTALEFVGVEAEDVRFRSADGREVRVDGDAGEAWPEDIVRAGDLAGRD